MRLEEIKSQETVFIDANIFLYHFGGASCECKELIKRCETGDIVGVTAITVLAEICHRLILAEAIKYAFISSGKPALQLKKKPQVVKKLSEYYTQIMDIGSWGIKIIAPPEDIFIKSQVYRSRFGLLTNDSLIPVYMAFANTAKLATANQGFMNIPSLEVYLPSDIA